MPVAPRNGGRGGLIVVIIPADVASAVVVIIPVVVIIGCSIPFCAMKADSVAIFADKEFTILGKVLPVVEDFVGLLRHHINRVLYHISYLFGKM